MPRVDKWLFADVQKHKRNAEYMEEGYGRKGGAKASGGKRGWTLDERDSGRKQGQARRSERSYA